MTETTISFTPESQTRLAALEERSPALARIATTIISELARGKEEKEFETEGHYIQGFAVPGVDGAKLIL